jgi:hypothetical protein
MTSIPNNYEKVLSEMIFSKFSSNLKKELNKNNINPTFNYINLSSNLDNTLCNLAKESLIAIFKAIDTSYCNSIERKRKHHIKAHLPRTILTIFGEITFTRTFYTDRNNKGSYCYLDRFLGLKKHDYFDPYIKAVIVEKAANNSIPTVCDFINDLIGNKIKLENKINYLNRQTVRNIILDAKISIPEKIELETPDTIYIIADEKWAPTQNNNGSKVMVKSIVVFDSIKGTKRKFLNNKKVFANFENGFLDEVLDYLYYTYDMDKIKNIVIMGDGAKWIKALTYHFKINDNTNVIFALDKFHFKQAIHHICLNKNLEDILSSYVINDSKRNFNDFVEELKISLPHRKETIEKKREYILNNWNYILNLYKYNLSCPMESQISHNLAYLLTSRPKGYSLNMLLKIIKIRLLHRNEENIKILYLNNFNKKDIVEYKKEEYTSYQKGYYINYNKLIQKPIYDIPYDNSYNFQHI